MAMNLWEFLDKNSTGLGLLLGLFLFGWFFWKIIKLSSER